MIQRRANASPSSEPGGILEPYGGGGVSHAQLCDTKNEPQARSVNLYCFFAPNNHSHAIPEGNQGQKSRKKEIANEVQVHESPSESTFPNLLSSDMAL